MRTLLPQKFLYHSQPPSSFQSPILYIKHMCGALYADVPRPNIKTDIPSPSTEFKRLISQQIEEILEFGSQFVSLS